MGGKKIELRQALEDTQVYVMNGEKVKIWVGKEDSCFLI